MMVSISLYEAPAINERFATAQKEKHRLTIHKAEKLQTLITAAKVEGVEPIWTTLFAKVRFTH